MRRGLRDVALDRQRTLFGVDRMERLCGDMAAELIRMSAALDILCAAAGVVSRETHHMERVKTWLLQYEETQKAEWNGVKEVLDGAAQKSE